MHSQNQRLPSNLFYYLSILLLLSWSGVSFAASRMVESVDVSTDAAETSIEFNFSMPLQYQRHSPAQTGKLFQIDLRSLASIQDINEFAQRYDLSWDKTAADRLAEISYEGFASGQVRLLLRFQEVVNFRLVAGSNPRNLQVTVNPVEVAAPLQPVPPAPSDETKEVKSGQESDPAKRYAINLRSSLTPISLANLPAQEVLKQYQLYTTEAEKSGRIWYRLRLGFFATQKDATEVSEKLQKHFPEAWVTKAPKSDHLVANGKRPVVTETAEPLAEVPPVVAPDVTVPLTETAAAAAAAITEGTAASSEQIAQAAPEAPAGTDQPAEAGPLIPQKEQQLFEEAEKAMVEGNYRRAVQIYFKLTQSTDPAINQQAQEFLGLARERNGQLAHAKAEYEKYLKLYPEGEAAERVKQRLAGLLTARTTPKERLRKAKQPIAEDQWQTEAYGSFSQFYDRDVTFTQADETIVNRSALSSDLDINLRARNDNFDIRTTFIGGLENDFEDNEDDVRVSSLYVDALAKKIDLSARIGRQSRSTGGVLGRFDGGLLRWQMLDSVAVNLVAGFPVMSTTDTDIDTDRPLYGISFDLGTFAKRWDFNTFFITQDVDGIIDRQAIGGEVRYFHPTHSFFTLVDYDIDYNELNTILFTGNWTLAKKTTLNMSFDYRNSPILTTSNALQGQGTDSIDELLDDLSEDQVRQLALDRTARSRTYTLGITHQLHEKLQISGDISVSKFGSTPASDIGGVVIEAQPGTDYEYFYSLQFIGSSLIKEGDIAIIGLRYSDTDRSDTYSVSVNTRYPVTRDLRINPRAVIDYRNNKDDDGEQWKFRPLLRLEYRWKRRFQLELEGGWEWSNIQTADQEEDDTQGYFFTVGYRINF